MTDFLHALRAEAAKVDARIDELKDFARELSGLEERKGMIGDLISLTIDPFGADGPAAPGEVLEELPDLREAKAAVADVTAADTKVIATIEPAPSAGPPRAAAPDVLAPRPKAVPASTLLSQRQQVLCDREGIEAYLLPSQIKGPKGAPYDCTEVQACLVAVLVSVMPSVMGEKALADRAYGMCNRKVTPGTVGMVAYEVRDLNSKLAGRGIEIVMTKGIGYSIKTID